MGITVQFEPLATWPRAQTPSHRRKRSAPFKVGFERCLKDLLHEIELLRASRLIVRLAIDPSEIRRDGFPYANALPRHPGIIVAAPTRFGAKQWACDRFWSWQDNLRAIGLTLERLRLVDLYGVTAGGEQYAGFALPAPDPDMPGSELSACEVLSRFSGVSRSSIISDPTEAQRASGGHERRRSVDAPVRSRRLRCVRAD